MPIPSRTRGTGRALAALTTLALLVAACGGAQPEGPDGAGADAPQSAATSSVTVDNCGTSVEIESPPERIVVLGRPGIFAILQRLGAADRVVARAGAFPDVYYDREGRAALEEIPSLGDDLDEAGHLQISHETLLAQDPDLVIGLPDGIDRGRLEESGISLLRQPGNCPQGIADVGYEHIHDEVERYGRILGRAEAAEQLSAELRERVAAIEEEAADIGQDRTAAVLYPTVGGGTLYAYGTQSMSHRQLETAGMTNVFGDADERVFEVTGEEVIARDPDVLLLLHVDGEPGPVADAVRALPGGEGMSAVRDDAMIVQRLSFSEYPTPLVVDGLEHLVDALEDET